MLKIVIFLNSKYILYKYDTSDDVYFIYALNKVILMISGKTKVNNETQNVAAIKATMFD